LAEGQPEKPLVEENLSSQLTRWLSYRLIHVETEVSKHPHNTLDSLRAKISEVMADIDREVVIFPCKKFRSQIEAIVEDSGDFID
jgi:hypothetical protein